MKNLIKIGLVGYGYWGKNLARNLHSLNSLSSICDNNQSNLEKATIQYPQITTFTNIEDLLKSNVDAVFISTPAVTHEKLVRKALYANKHVFVEKPICLDVSQAIILKNLADQKGLKLMVGHLLLYHPAFIALQSLIKNGGIGNIRYIYSNRLSLGKLRKEENALWSFAPHDISMILSLIGKEPINIYASGGNYLNKNIADTTMTLMTFDDNIKAHVFVSWLHPFKDQRLVVVGDKAMATFVDVEKGEKKLMLYNHDVSWKGDVSVIEKADGKAINYDMSKEPLNEECKSFINWIKNDIKPASDASEAIRVLKVLDKADEDLKRNK